MTFVLFLKAPVGLLEFTVDGVTAQCDKNFEGFKSVPPGIHFFSYRYSRGGENGANTCIILDCPRASTPVLVFAWDSSTEQFTLTHSEAFSTENILKYPFLASYSTFMGPEGAEKWQLWSSNLTSAILERCFSACIISCIIPAYAVTPMSESHHSLLKHPDASSSPSNVLYFTQIPSLKQFSASASPEQVTQAACDRSVILSSLNVSFSELLGELELSFLLLVIAQNFEGFEQWMSILELLTSSISFAQANSGLYDRLFGVLLGQFEFCPNDFFTGLLSENKLFLMLGRLITSLQPKTRQVKKFCEFFEGKFGVQLDGFDFDEEGEFAPVIVEE